MDRVVFQCITLILTEFSIIIPLLCMAHDEVKTQLTNSFISWKINGHRVAAAADVSIMANFDFGLPSFLSFSESATFVWDISVHRQQRMSCVKKNRKR
jgi:hypothetical protein